MKVLVQPKLLIIDEIGCLPLDPHQASMLFELIAKRYERALPAIITSNKAFGQRGQVFANDSEAYLQRMQEMLAHNTFQAKRTANLQHGIEPPRGPTLAQDRDRGHSIF
jgi:DNA replication protein DnaC